MRVLILLCLFVLPVGATWERMVLTPKGERVDAAKPHPLAYFTEFPFLRDESGDLCSAGCTAEQIDEVKKIKIKTELTQVGTLKGFAIYDLYYRFEREGSPDTKMILVKTDADEYREIYHCEPATGGPVPSRFVTVGKDTLLEATYIVGTKADPLNDYYWFDQTGPTLLDFAPVLAAAKSALPKGGSLSWFYDEGIPGAHYLWRAGLPLLSRMAIYKDNDAFGSVEVKFRFERGRVVPTTAKHVLETPGQQ